MRIEELTVILDRQLSSEERDEERIKHLRQATGQITRSANDGIQAYRRIASALRAEASHPDADPVEIADATRALAEARTRMLAALEVASQRYPCGQALERGVRQIAEDPVAEATGSVSVLRSCVA